MAAFEISSPIPGCVRWVLSGCLLLAACSAPPAEPLDAASLSSELEQRSEIESLRAALERSALSPLIDAERRSSSLDSDATRVEFWRASARAWSLPLRRALAQHAISVAATRSAGLPGDFAAGAEIDDVENADASIVTRASVDVLGIFGLGPSAAAKRLAAERVRAAQGAVEAAWWRARFDVERARVALAAARARVAALRELVLDLIDDSKRLDVYAERGWLPEAPSAAARALIARAAKQLADAEHAERGARASLARASGLLSNDAALAKVEVGVLEEYGSQWDAARAAEPLRDLSKRLVRAHPELRASFLDYAVAESALQRAAAEAWPGIRVGPKLRLEPNDLLGGFLELRLPWPGRVDAAVELAIQRRQRVRIEVEERVRDLVSRVREGRSSFAAARRALEQARRLEQASRASWIAAQARWEVDAKTLGNFNDALERRISAAVAAINALEFAVRAWLDLQEAEGVQR